MTRRPMLWWFRRPWRWQVANVLVRLGRCWSDLVSWAMPPRRALRDVGRQSTCAREPATLRRGVCYCGLVGPASPAAKEAARRHARFQPLTRGAAATLAVVAALALAASIPQQPTSGRVPPPPGITERPGVAQVGLCGGVR